MHFCLNARDCGDVGQIPDIPEITACKIARDSYAAVGFRANCGWIRRVAGFQMLKDRVTEFGLNDTGWRFF